MSSDKPIGADDQQGRLESYLSGFADGEGSFSVGVTRRLDLVNGYQLVPEFRVSQNGERATVLSLYREVLGCGSIRQNDRNRLSDRTLVYVVRRRRELLERVIPLLQTQSTSLREEGHLRDIRHHRSSDGGRHPPLPLGFRAFGADGLRDERGRAVSEVVPWRGDRKPEPSETVRRTSRANGMKIQSELHGDMQSQAEMTWPSPTRSGRK